MKRLATIGVSCFAVLCLTQLGACTRYGTTQSYGPPREVGRVLVGAPMVETVTASSMSAGFAGTSVRGAHGTRHGAGVLSGDSGTVSRTQCVQQAQIDLVQTVDTTPVVHGRAWDVTGAVVLGLVGLSVYGAARSSYNFDVDSWQSKNEFYQRDPNFFPHPGAYPSEPTGTYAFAGGLALGGAALLVYSFAMLPKGPPPAPTRGERRWTETQYVPATGCGLVPADQPQAQPPMQPYPPPQ